MFQPIVYFLCSRRKAKNISHMQNSAEPVYIIDKVIRYEPSKGYLVKWSGFGDKYNSWQKPRDMPVALHPDMKAVKKVYDASAKLLRSRVQPGPRRPHRSTSHVDAVLEQPTDVGKVRSEQISESSKMCSNMFLTRAT